LVELPNRSYGLFEGALAGVTSIDIAHRRRGQPPNLWWPSDRSWIVASDIDLQWTYVAGSTQLIEALLGEPKLEVLVVEPNDSCTLTLSGWLGELVERAATEVANGDSATLSLSLGTVQISWRRLGVRANGTLLTSTTGPNGTSSSESPLRSGDAAYRRLVIHATIQRAVLALVS
jgi:hypothetical protein